MVDEFSVIDPKLEVLRRNKEDGFNYRSRRQDDWDENYSLYRDKVTINRLIQRQSVNIPMMKQTIRTLLKDVDDMPVLYYENLDNDKQAETFLNEYWKKTVELNHMELQDIVDKRQVFLYGRSFDQWQVIDGKVKMTIQDPEDILVSRYTDPTDIHTSRFLVHTHIFQPLSTLGDNPDYDQEAVGRLKEFFASEMGIVKAADNLSMLQKKNTKLEEMGVPDVDNPVLGETYVELSLHFVYDKREGSDEEELFLKVECQDMEILMSKPLEEVIGVTKDHFWKNHFPYNSWADDVERQDFWSDGIADIVRTPNKILNSWFSQMVENRTLRNFGMNYFDATIEGWTPPTNEPIPGGWYGLPGKPGEVYQKVDIPDLSDSLDEMSFVIQMVEKSTGATTTQQGATADRQITLGEVQLALGEAKERIKGMSKFYTPAWKERGRMFLKLIEAAGSGLEAVKIYKQGKNTTDIYEREIGPKDWMTKSGYREQVWSQDEKNIQDTNTLQKLNATKVVMPGNAKLEEIYKRKLLEFAGLTPEQINDIMEAEEQKLNQINSMINNPEITGPNQPAAVMPEQPAAPVAPVPAQ